MNIAVNSVSVQATNDACIISKCSTVEKGYANDDFIRFFVDKKRKRAPLIHLGYYSRLVIIENVIQTLYEFLLKTTNKIISCGAGYDTLYWRLSQKYSKTNWTLIEVDFPMVLSRKLSLIKASKELSSYVDTSIEWNLCENVIQVCDNYYMVGCDLSDLPQLEKNLNVCSDFELPTMFISECAVTYMQKNDSDALISWMSSQYKHCGIINYEQIQPDDGYGRAMMNHFDSLKSPLRSVTSYPFCRHHRQRYLDLGFENSFSIDEWSLLRRIVAPLQISSAFEREQFDEFEELHSKCLHYVIAMASKGVMENWWSALGLNANSDNFDVEAHSLKCQFMETPLRLYGHSSMQKESDIFLFGGVNPSGKSSVAYKLQKVRETIAMFQLPTEGDTSLNATHGSTALFTLQESNYLACYGGRISPSRVWLDGGLLVLDLSLNKVVCSDISLNPTPRYRSPLVLFYNSAEKAVFFLFGGRATDLSVKLNDFWQLEITSDPWRSEWREIIVTSSSVMPSARMSHCLTASEDGIFLSCGLDAISYEALGDIWKWNFESKSWHQMLVIGKIHPRYGHTSHILSEKLILVGGVSTVPGPLPLVAVLSFTTLTVQHFSVEIPSPMLFLPFNHTSEVLQDTEELLIVGGGGQCFSFGTHLNEFCLSINLRQVKNCKIGSDGTVELRPKSHWFSQIQGQLNITGRLTCYLILYTPAWIHLIIVKKDEKYWTEEMVPKLEKFYNGALLPEIVEPMLRKRGLPSDIRVLYSLPGL